MQLSGDEPEDLINCESFSSLRRLLRTTAYVLKFVKAIKIKVRRSREVLNAELDGTDLAVAELYWIQACQRVSVHNKKFEEWKTQFGLYLDDANLWRCKGRLGCAGLPEATRHPIFLPSGHYFTTLLILDCHQCVMHGGIKEMLTELRARFWVVKGRSVEGVASVCDMYAIQWTTIQCPNSPPLPHFRVNASPPFSSIGVDYAWLLYIKGTGNKIWIALLTCCVTCAIHLELVPDMTTETFIRCIRRFTCRRGTPTRIVSDNSKTFKAASKELARIQADPIIKDYFEQLRVCWSFNVAKAPWWGGFYERLVGSVKRCLKKVVGNTRLTFDELLTVIKEVEATPNSRPLTYVAADDIQEPLTPAHLLTGYHLLGLPDPHSVLEQDADFVVFGDHSSITTWMEYTRRLPRHFWKRWRSEYLISLRDTHKYMATSCNGKRYAATGDIVLVHDENHPRTFRKLGRVERLIEGHDGLVRAAVVRVASESGTTTQMRPVQLLYPLELNDLGTVETENAEKVEAERAANRPRRNAAEIAKLKMSLQMQEFDDSDPEN